jgi:hypothetical protein
MGLSLEDSTLDEKKDALSYILSAKRPSKNAVIPAKAGIQFFRGKNPIQILNILIQ